MLKHVPAKSGNQTLQAATFGWLCVETPMLLSMVKNFDAATFGWLCVETDGVALLRTNREAQPPSGGCVLKR